jgi:hypothetical protein
MAFLDMALLLPSSVKRVSLQGHIFRSKRIDAKSDYWLRHVCPSVHMELGSRWTDLHEIGYLRIF